MDLIRSYEGAMGRHARGLVCRSAFLPSQVAGVPVRREETGLEIAVPV